MTIIAILTIAVVIAAFATAEMYADWRSVRKKSKRGRTHA